MRGAGPGPGHDKDQLHQETVELLSLQGILHLYWILLIYVVYPGSPTLGIEIIVKPLVLFETKFICQNKLIIAFHIHCQAQIQIRMMQVNSTQKLGEGN